MTRRLAFYAPLKSPEHPVASGDRTVARLYRRALELAGFDVTLASQFRSLDRAGEPSRQNELIGQASAENRRVLAQLSAEPPALWFTYHCHYKAPDLIGPAVAGALGIPYVLAEPSHAPKRAGGPWALFHEAAERAIGAADLAIAVTMRDLVCVAAVRHQRPTMLLLPFVDAGAMPVRAKRENGILRMITVAMMREGDKLASYRLLAQMLAHLSAGHWHLTIVGDGPARGMVERLFDQYANQISFTGLIEQGPALQALLVQADVLVWPGVNEAYGMAFLEAQAAGVVVVAGREGGIADVVRDGETGLLTPPRDAAGLAQAVMRLAGDDALRQRMSVAARDFVRSERSLAVAAARLGEALAQATGGAGCVS